jgi:hypothetical protein
MHPRSFGWQQLAKVQHREILIDFRFVTLPSHALDQKPSEIRILGNRVEVVMRHYETSEGWQVAQMALAVTGPGLGLNVLGLGMLAIDALSSKTPALEKADLLRLKQSPAFLKPLHSIDLP